jgi:hypothetical protein
MIWKILTLYKKGFIERIQQIEIQIISNFFDYHIPINQIILSIEIK